jgi:hypothetical protein
MQGGGAQTSFPNARARALAHSNVSTPACVHSFSSLHHGDLLDLRDFFEASAHCDSFNVDPELTHLA